MEEESTVSTGLENHDATLETKIKTDKKSQAKE